VGPQDSLGSSHVVCPRSAPRHICTRTGRVLSTDMGPVAATCRATQSARRWCPPVHRLRSSTASRCALRSVVSPPRGNPSRGAADSRRSRRPGADSARVRVSGHSSVRGCLAIDRASCGAMASDNALGVGRDAQVVERRMAVRWGQLHRHLTRSPGTTPAHCRGRSPPGAWACFPRADAKDLEGSPLDGAGLPLRRPSAPGSHGMEHRGLAVELVPGGIRAAPLLRRVQTPGGRPASSLTACAAGRGRCILSPLSRRLLLRSYGRVPCTQSVFEQYG